MSTIELKRKFTKMNSDQILNLLCKGQLTEREIHVAATIIERRFPTPSHIK